MRQIIITLPDDEHIDQDAEYVSVVAQQVREGYTSGHVNVEHHWRIER